MYRIVTLVFVASLILSCTQVYKPAAPLTYLYVYDHSDNDSYTLTDSVMVYSDLPFERSLELYKDSDTLTKQVDQYLYLSIFELQKEKFAVIADSATTNFYKYLPGGTYKKEYTMPMSLGAKAFLTKKDLNADGYSDVLFTLPSGGFYGEDNLLLFYNPKTHGLVYHDKPSIVNITFDGDTVTSNTKFLDTTWLIKGFDFLLLQQTEYLQGNDDDKKVVSRYNQKGIVVSRDTVKAEPAEW